MSEPRRNPKRKAPDGSTTQSELLDRILERSCAPLSEEEIEDWQGWFELESEPAFFNYILSNVGVRDVKTLELFTLDPGSLDALPKPVFGLIFLFQYSPALDNQDEQDTAQDSVWFANQTTHNACATVALLNIIMNAADIDLGDELRKFKEDTKDLSTPLRGRRISTNKFIRSIHNSFTRRMDHLNADLALEHEVAKSKRKQKRNAKPQSRKSGDEYGFHFIAYVPSDGCIWELDGLNNHPHKIGEIDSNEWTQVARPQIEARMQQYEESQLSFNLLALCRSPRVVYSQTIAKALASIRALEHHMQDNDEFQQLISADEPLLDCASAPQLAEFNLTASDIEKHEKALREDFGRGMAMPDAYQLYQKLRDEASAAMGQYRSELFAIADDEQRVEGRKRDFTSAIHCWLSKLAEKGVLQDMIKTS